ncbi:multidrug ABC transporter ATP-binding protein [Peribacillus muralis]|uniref:Multidrug ABC transporter ATP-binding protein n=2 Tax=Peribacillus TaxID=2675229 RepID=A0A1B3XVN8_9BACI|nr:MULTISPECIES: ABC transporter ATP-binding protein [Peribacillus]AOH57283.1 multidrug ABC transporter ATP-binding protein [Peribacillus muralis]KWW21006.1 multidrug ABC transporter ATP-binding protein [Peribacillus simplex]
MIEVHDLSKKLKKNNVLQSISYTFEKGRIYGLVGKNGSGKTMLLRALAGLIIPTDGSVTIDGKILHKDISFPPSIGIIIENLELLPQFDAETNLKILAAIKKTASLKDIQHAIKRLELDQFGTLKVRKYSLGMKQRLNIAQAIFEKPDIILLDEPTNAIDEKGVERVLDILQEERERGATIIIATHNKDDVFPICDEVIEISNGRLT